MKGPSSEKSPRCEVSAANKLPSPQKSKKEPEVSLIDLDDTPSNQMGNLSKCIT